MEFVFKNVRVNYEIFGNGKNLFVFLHGWGAGLNFMFPLAKNFGSEALCLLVDFPPFGKSEEPLSPWSLQDYVNLTCQLILKTRQEFETQSTVVFGHSFGGRVAICLASEKKFEINALVLLASAGIKPKFSLKNQINIWRFKLYKKIGSSKANNFGSSDYKILSPVMKQTFKNIINLDLKPRCQEIDAKTLIIFGSNDSETPLYMGKKLKKAIPKSSLFIIENAGHFAYIEKIGEVLKIVNTFLKLNC